MVYVYVAVIISCKGAPDLPLFFRGHYLPAMASLYSEAKQYQLKQTKFQYLGKKECIITHVSIEDK